MPPLSADRPTPVCPVDFGFTDSGYMTVTVDFVQMKVTFVK